MLDRLRPLSRRLRGRFKPPVFTVRRWLPDPPGAPRSVTGPLAYDVLWRTAKHPLVHVDAPFAPVDGYSIADSRFVPLIDVATRSGETYLSMSFCPRTGVVFHRLLPSPEWQHNYYASSWDRGQAPDTTDAASLLARRSDKVGAILGTRVRPGMRVLDVGCGYGDQLFYLKQRKCVVQGIEPSLHRAQFAARELGVPVLNCPIDSDDILERLGAASFDLIYLNQVLEHLPDPLRALRAVEPLLAPGGRLMIGVPDLFFESLASFCGEITHTHSFSAVALGNVAALAGYRPVADLSFPGYLYWLFESAGQPVALRDPGAPEVFRYVLRHFGIEAAKPITGDTISISSTYTGATELGLRLNSAPSDGQWRKFKRAARAGDVETVREHLPVTLTMPYERPVLWMK